MLNIYSHPSVYFPFSILSCELNSTSSLNLSLQIIFSVPRMTPAASLWASSSPPPWWNSGEQCLLSECNTLPLSLSNFVLFLFLRLFHYIISITLNSNPLLLCIRNSFLLHNKPHFGNIVSAPQNLSKNAQQDYMQDQLLQKLIVMLFEPLLGCKEMTSFICERILDLQRDTRLSNLSHLQGGPRAGGKDGPLDMGTHASLAQVSSIGGKKQSLSHLKAWESFNLSQASGSLEEGRMLYWSAMQPGTQWLHGSSEKFILFFNHL